eukprot:maker-scaffold370_size193435-snap-gene-0.31 protein:Tk07790 transcript:maker-scaffold370_size193435-snap-gene-0.31-mRNA-1 annotation:"trna:m x modification enzyme trm13 homolog"
MTVPEDVARCQYMVPRKKRLCRMLVKPDRKYCGEHAHHEPHPPQTEGGLDVSARLPCPYDPEHTVKPSKLAGHLPKCRSRPAPKPEYCQAGVNVPSPPDATGRQLTIHQVGDEPLMGLIERVEHLYATQVEHAVQRLILDHPVLQAELGRPFYGPAVLKHLKQNASLLGHLQANRLLEDETIFIEFGSGRGLLTYWLSQSVPQSQSCHFVLVDKASHRHKFDNKLRQSTDLSVERIRTDIQDLFLPKLPIIRDSSKDIVGVSKHLCGPATDLALRSCQHLEASRIRGLMIALCCHHRCVWHLFAGVEYLQELGFSREEFDLLCGLTSWATCGSGKPRGQKEPDPSTASDEVEGRYDRLKLPRERRESIGRKVKRIFDVARARYVNQTLGLKSHLYYYCDPEISLENVVLLSLRDTPN